MASELKMARAFVFERRSPISSAEARGRPNRTRRPVGPEARQGALLLVRLGPRLQRPGGRVAEVLALGPLDADAPIARLLSTQLARDAGLRGRLGWRRAPIGAGGKFAWEAWWVVRRSSVSDCAQGAAPAVLPSRGPCGVRSSRFVTRSPVRPGDAGRLRTSVAGRSIRASCGQSCAPRRGRPCAVPAGHRDRAAASFSGRP